MFILQQIYLQVDSCFLTQPNCQAFYQVSTNFINLRLQLRTVVFKVSIQSCKLLHHLHAIMRNGMVIPANLTYISINKKAVLLQRWPRDAPTKVNKQPHLHLRSRDSRLTQFNQTLWTYGVERTFSPQISPFSPGSRWRTFGLRRAKMLG